jgi:steroid delta-isomerase-like uncharacterized protein
MRFKKTMLFVTFLVIVGLSIIFSISAKEATSSENVTLNQEAAKLKELVTSLNEKVSKLESDLFVFEGGKMTIQENKNIARRFIQVWGQGNLDIIDELAAPSISVHYPVMPQIIRGTQMFRQILEGFRSAIPDSKLIIEEEIAEDDKVMIRWSFSGTHQGSVLGIPGTGRKVKWTGITIYRIVEGKVMEEKGEEDNLGFLRQVGFVPKPQ